MWDYPHTVTFQKYEEIPDGGGGYTKQWSDVLTTEAHVQPVSSRLAVEAQKLDAPIDHKIFYPYQTGITEDMRAFWQDEGAYLQLRSNPLNQGGLNEVNMVRAQWQT